MSKISSNSAAFAATVFVALLAIVSIVVPAVADSRATAGVSATDTVASERAVDETPVTAEENNAAATEDQAAEDEAAKEEAAEQEAHDQYVSTWAERIDAFNAGYPLAGYGATFAEAAYAYGMDPRYAPAIARVESGSGANCTYYCNAWGWGARSWSDWDSAIWGFMGEFSAAYGRTLSYGAALSYNELNPDGWYAEVESAMYQIWGDESL